MSVSRGLSSGITQPLVPPSSEYILFWKLQKAGDPVIWGVDFSVFTPALPNLC